jgi:hypothetical protein
MALPRRRSASPPGRGRSPEDPLTPDWERLNSALRRFDLTAPPRFDDWTRRRLRLWYGRTVPLEEVILSLVPAFDRVEELTHVLYCLTVCGGGVNDNLPRVEGASLGRHGCIVHPEGWSGSVVSFIQRSEVEPRDPPPAAIDAARLRGRRFLARRVEVPFATPPVTNLLSFAECLDAYRSRLRAIYATADLEAQSDPEVLALTRMMAPFGPAPFGRDQATLDVLTGLRARQAELRRRAATRTRVRMLTLTPRLLSL